MSKTKLVLVNLLFISSLSLLSAQQEFIREEPFLSVGSHFGIDFPAADLADRYGWSMHAGLSLRLFRPKAKGFLAIEGSAQYGDRVKEDVLEPIRLESGAILGNQGQVGQIFLRRRGIYLGLYANKILLSSKDNPNTGLALGVGLGVWQHHIRLLDEQSTVRQVAGDYSKGYDRSTRGPALKQTISYEHIGKNRSLNYSLGLTIMEGFTKSVRAVNFDTGTFADSSRRLDLTIGLEAIWYLPIRELDAKSDQEVFY